MSHSAFMISPSMKITVTDIFLNYSATSRTPHQYSHTCRQQQNGPQNAGSKQANVVTGTDTSTDTCMNKVTDTNTDTDKNTNTDTDKNTGTDTDKDTDKTTNMERHTITDRDAETNTDTDTDP